MNKNLIQKGSGDFMYIYTANDNPVEQGENQLLEMLRHLNFDDVTCDDGHMM